MTNTTRTGRGLDVNALANATAKVTLGFKCEAQLKMDLAIEADRYSMSLSEYVEVLVARRHENHSENENRGEIERLKKRLGIYENEKLYKIFEKFKGKAIPYMDNNFVERQIIVSDLPDAFFAVISSVKI
ncbi:MAG: hypothetical protein CFE21_18405 [Bacteroidetes bacterium B1(2017)]|nr:MAG: hypothetical protein CFE21_18405 [Bacteroidetes bacterium B1(2017)]